MFDSFHTAISDPVVATSPRRMDEQHISALPVTSIFSAAAVVGIVLPDVDLRTFKSQVSPIVIFKDAQTFIRAPPASFAISVRE